MRSEAPGAREQMQLVAELIPYVPPEFALKGGTAINMFHRDLPRYSVDLDLVYLPRTDRKSALDHIRELLGHMRHDVVARLRGLYVSQVQGKQAGVLRLRVQKGEVEVVVETSLIGRETVHPTAIRDAVPEARAEFGLVEMRVVSFEEMYAGKMRASLSRRLLRDMFDIEQLFRHEGITDDLFKTFLVYMVTGSHPPYLILSPEWMSKPMPKQKRWEELMRLPVSPEALLDQNNRLRDECVARLTPDVLSYLLDAHDGQADPRQIGLPQAATLPAFKWRMLQRRRFKESKPHEHARQRRQIEGLVSRGLSF